MRLTSSFACSALVGLVVGCGHATRPTETPSAETAPQATDAAHREQDATPPAPATSDADPQDVGETLGALHLGMSATEVEGLLGRPVATGEVIEEPATGDMVQAWRYPDLGLTVTMLQSDAPAVLRILAEPPCKLVTSRGIGIGSPRAALEQAYASDRDEEMSHPDALVVGSAYGGTVFLLESDAVASIFLGASAE